MKFHSKAALLVVVAVLAAFALGKGYAWPAVPVTFEGGTPFEAGVGSVDIGLDYDPVCSSDGQTGLKIVNKGTLPVRLAATYALAYVDAGGNILVQDTGGIHFAQLSLWADGALVPHLLADAEGASGKLLPGSAPAEDGLGDFVLLPGQELEATGVLEGVDPLDGASLHIFWTVQAVLAPSE